MSQRVSQPEAFLVQLGIMTTSGRIQECAEMIEQVRVEAREEALEEAASLAQSVAEKYDKTAPIDDHDRTRIIGAIGAARIVRMHIQHALAAPPAKEEAK